MNIQPIGLITNDPPRGGATRIPLAIWNHSGSSSLRGADGSYPHITIADGVHASPAAIIHHARGQLGLDVAVLRVGAAGLIEVECLRVCDALPPAWTWQPSTMSPAIERRVDWQRPGWLRGVLRAADRELGSIGLTRLGVPAQVRHTSLTGMLRVTTDGGPVWLKAVPPLFAHEAVVIRWLEGIATYDVPRVLALRDGWWLSAEFGPVADPPLGDPLVSLAETQAALLQRVDELRALGCPERPLAALPPSVSDLARRDDLLGDDDRRRVRGIVPALERLCAGLDALDLPATLVHGDVSPGNVRWTGVRWLVYDWTDACIAHPFLELASPLSYEADRHVAARRADAFAAVWASWRSGRAAAGALAAAPALGAAHQAVTYATILDAIDRTGGDQAGGDRLAAFLGYWVDRLLCALSG